MSGSFSGTPFNGSHRGVRVIPYTDDRKTDPLFMCNRAFPGLVMLGHSGDGVWSDMVEGQCIFTEKQFMALNALNPGHPYKSVRILGVVREPIINGENAYYNPDSCGITSVVNDGVMAVCVKYDPSNLINYGDFVGIKDNDVFIPTEEIQVDEGDVAHGNLAHWGGSLCAKIQKVSPRNACHILGRVVDCSNVKNGEILVDMCIQNSRDKTDPKPLNDAIFMCNTLFADPPVQPVYIVVSNEMLKLDKKALPRNVPVFSCNNILDNDMNVVKVEGLKKDATCKCLGVLVEGNDRDVNVLLCRGTTQIYVCDEDMKGARPGDSLGFRIKATDSSTGIDYSTNSFNVDIDGHVMTIPRPVLTRRGNQNMILWNYLGNGVATVILNAP